MTHPAIHQLAIWAALAAAGVAACGEWLHMRRIRRLGSLAFGPAARPRAWTRMVPILRVAALAGVAWSLVTLIAFNNLVRDRDRRSKSVRHLMVLLDVSPSMLISDAGEGSLLRMQRASEVLMSVLDRVPGDNVRFSAAAFYTEARMLVSECKDRELMLHLAGGIPFHITYAPGKTDLLKSINEAGALMKDWNRKFATLLVISDGDSLPPGDPGRGTFIDGHMSRQDTAKQQENLESAVQLQRLSLTELMARPLPREGQCMANQGLSEQMSKRRGKGQKPGVGEGEGKKPAPAAGMQRYQPGSGS